MMGKANMMLDILIANAGIDQSNAEEGKAIMWPKDPEKTTREIWNKLKKERKINNLGIIMNDSRCVPLRSGTIGFALATAGFEAVEDEIGKPDLFGKKMRVTKKAVADMLASAANFLMGDCSEAVPLVIIRDAKVKFSAKKQNASLLIHPYLCLFFVLIKKS